jgi:hypothetical protein
MTGRHRARCTNVRRRLRAWANARSAHCRDSQPVANPTGLSEAQPDLFVSAVPGFQWKWLLFVFRRGGPSAAPPRPPLSSSFSDSVDLARAATAAETTHTSCLRLHSCLRHRARRAAHPCRPSRHPIAASPSLRRILRSPSARKQHGEGPQKLPQ